MPRITPPDNRKITVGKLRFSADAFQLSEADGVLVLTPDEREQMIRAHLQRVGEALTREPGVSDQRMRAMGELHQSLLLGQEKLENDTRLGSEEVLHSFFARRSTLEGHLCTEANGIREATEGFFRDFEAQYEQLPHPLRERCAEIAATYDDATVEDLLLDGIHTFVYLGPIEAGRAEEIYIEGLDHIEETLKNLKSHFKI